MNLENHTRNALTTAALTTAATTLAALVVSKLETGSAPAGLNATSHILWGDEAAAVDGFEPKYTLAGALLNASAMLAWSMLHEAAPHPRGPFTALAKGLLTSGVAYVTDYHLVPARLTPGFEKRFSQRGLASMYGVLGAAFGLAGIVASHRR